MSGTIVSAFVTLARALPGLRDISVCRYASHTSVTLVASSDDEARALAEMFEVTLADVSVPTATWLQGHARGDEDVVITVSGPHHPRTQVAKLDEAKLAAALELAREAVAL